MTDPQSNVTRLEADLDSLDDSLCMGNFPYFGSTRRQSTAKLGRSSSDYPLDHPGGSFVNVWIRGLNTRRRRSPGLPSDSGLEPFHGIRTSSLQVSLGMPKLSVGMDGSRRRQWGRGIQPWIAPPMRVRSRWLVSDWLQ
ncbi:hypothetical protein BJX96DRAFT_70293 [Aspergillus floccosus]